MVPFLRLAQPGVPTAGEAQRETSHTVGKQVGIEVFNPPGNVQIAYIEDMQVDAYIQCND